MPILFRLTLVFCRDPPNGSRLSPPSRSAQGRVGFGPCANTQRGLVLARVRRVGLVLDPARIRSEGLSPRSKTARLCSLSSFDCAAGACPRESLSPRIALAEPSRSKTARLCSLSSFDCAAGACPRESLSSRIALAECAGSGCSLNLRGFEARVFLAGMRRFGLVLEPARSRSGGRLAGCANVGSVYNTHHRRHQAPYLLPEGQGLPPRLPSRSITTRSCSLSCDVCEVRENAQVRFDL